MEGRSDGLPDLMTSDGMFRLKMQVPLGTSVKTHVWFPQNQGMIPITFQ